MNKARAWLPAIVWSVVIFILSSLPPLLPKEQNPGLVPTDKLAHLAAYGLLGGLVLHALRRGHQLPLLRRSLLAIVLAAAYGAFDEWHQSFVPNRFASLNDWVADALGAVAVALVYYAYESYRGRKTHR